MGTYVYAGNETVGDYVERMLAEVGWLREEEPEDADAVITYFTSQTALENAYFETDGFIKRAVPKTLLIDLSASTPSFARELAAVAIVNDLRPVEAPIALLNTMVEDAFADKKNVAGFVSGKKEYVEAASVIIRALIANPQYIAGNDDDELGDAGNAQLARAAFSIQIAAQVIAAVEADALVRATEANETFGRDMGGHADAVAPFAEQVLSAVADERFGGTYTVEMFMGEVTAALTAADDVELVLPQLEAGMHVLELLAVIGGVDKSPAALALLYRDEDEVERAGLDWSRAREFYTTDSKSDDGNGDADDGPSDEPYDDYLGGFGAYSAN